MLGSGAACSGLHFPVGSVQLRAGLSRTEGSSTCCSPTSQPPAPPTKLIKFERTGPRRQEHLRGEDSCGHVGAVVARGRRRGPVRNDTSRSACTLI